MLIFLSLTFYVVFLLLLAFVKGVGREVQKVGGEIEGVFTIFPIVLFFFWFKIMVPAFSVYFFAYLSPTRAINLGSLLFLCFMYLFYFIVWKISRMNKF